MLPAPERTLSGTLTAELQQSSRDVALGRFQVWITNGLPRSIKPRRIVYKDALLTRPVLGGRLRPIPSGSYRGYTLDLVEPVCGGKRRHGDGHRHLRRGRRDVPRRGRDGRRRAVGRRTLRRDRDRADRRPGVDVRHRGARAAAPKPWRCSGSRRRRPAARVVARSRSTPWAARRCSPPPTATSGPSASGCAATAGRHHGAAGPAGPLRRARVRLGDRRHDVLRQRDHRAGRVRPRSGWR